MKMWKKAASIALVSALTVSMAACGNGGEVTRFGRRGVHLRSEVSDLQQEMRRLWYGSTKRYPACD